MRFVIAEPSPQRKPQVVKPNYTELEFVVAEEEVVVVVYILQKDPNTSYIVACLGDSLDTQDETLETCPVLSRLIQQARLSQFEDFDDKTPKWFVLSNLVKAPEITHEITMNLIRETLQVLLEIDETAPDLIEPALEELGEDATLIERVADGLGLDLWEE